MRKIRMEKYREKWGGSESLFEINTFPARATIHSSLTPPGIYMYVYEHIKIVYSEVLLLYLSMTITPPAGTLSGGWWINR